MLLHHNQARKYIRHSHTDHGRYILVYQGMVLCVHKIRQKNLGYKSTAC